jgi:tRNA modification GTPase
MLHLDDTIVALSTPPGEGAIGVIRLSGKHAISIVNTLFNGKDLTTVEANTLHFGRIEDPKSAKLIDEVVVAVFHGPRSYTGEDVIEVSCHGSPYILKTVIDLCLSEGARMATRGEFTMRAFLNGKMDLSQAEAVADLIASDSAQSHQLAIHQMRSGFGEEIKILRQELIDFAALIELELDFSEEDVEFADRERLKGLVEQILLVIQRLRDSFRLGNVIKSGVSTVIAGRPNAGKSTLLNGLLNEDRAIVSDIAGTTRDSIEEILNINGIHFRIIDTAGIRAAQDQIESLGIERTFDKIQNSAILVYVFDVSTINPKLLWQDLDYILTKAIKGDFALLCLANKLDRKPDADLTSYHRDGILDSHNLLAISALHRTNIDSLKSKLYDLVITDPSLLDQTMVSNIRHHDALQKSAESLDAVIDGLMTGFTGDFIAMDLRTALHHLGSITGEVSSEELLDSIFGRFCIGK